MTYLNYMTLGRKVFEVYPYLVNPGTRIENILEGICEKWEETYHLRDSDFWLLKDPIAFDQVRSHPWLLDSSTDLADYATHVFRAEKLFDVWTDRQDKYLHAVLRIGGAH